MSGVNKKRFWREACRERNCCFFAHPRWRTTTATPRPPEYVSRPTVRERVKHEQHQRDGRTADVCIYSHVYV